MALVRRQNLANGMDLKSIRTIEEQDALSRPAIPATNAATAIVKVPVERVLSVSVLPHEKEDWTMCDLAEAVAE